jgi:hypothetical protein
VPAGGVRGALATSAYYRSKENNLLVGEANSNVLIIAVFTDPPAILSDCIDPR